MEIKGIITGIGNTITPEIDAALNDFIVGENTIIQGLTLNNGVLQAGMCQLCGYRGVISSNITGLSEVNDRLIYGRFVISFGEFSGEQQYDEFSIYTTKVKPTNGVINPSSITAAGIYYLELYADGASSLPPYRERENYQYPKTANISDRAKTLIDGGIISDLATTPTEKNEDGSVKVDLHKTQPNRVANTEYVHKQIEKEIAYEKVEGDVFEKNSTSQKIGTFILEKKSKFVILKLNINVRYGTPAKFMPNNFLPREDFYALIQTGGAYCNIYKITTSGEFIEQWVLDGQLSSDVQYTMCIGYECQ